MKLFMSWRLWPISLALVGWLCLLPASKAKTELVPGGLENIRVSEEAARTATNSPGGEDEGPSGQTGQNSPGGQAGNPSVTHPRPVEGEYKRSIPSPLELERPRTELGPGLKPGLHDPRSLSLEESLEKKLKRNRQERLELERLLEENRQERLALLRMRAAQRESQPAAAAGSASSTGSKAARKGLSSARPGGPITLKKAGTPTPSPTDTSKGSSPPDNKK